MNAALAESTNEGCIHTHAEPTALIHYRMSTSRARAAIMNHDVKVHTALKHYAALKIETVFITQPQLVGGVTVDSTSEGCSY